MSYAQTANRANPVAALGALGVPAAFGAILVIGLAVKTVIKDPIDNPIAVNITPTPPDPSPPPEPVEQQAQTTQPKQTETFVAPPVQGPIIFDPGPARPIDGLPNLGDIPTGPVELPGTITSIPSLPDPIAASPANNPGRWVTDSDYRTPWIRREYSGVARFKLTIDRNGKVSDCTITGSTGFSQLDEATCKLIERRARFEPAKDSYGSPVTGSYTSSVKWVLPE